ncbi:MAG TPA: hypothetical protein VI488_00560 [Candidatus Angelobacter sp.]
MDPFARKMIFGSLAFGAAMLLLAGVLSVVYFHNRPRCSERVLSEATSPDRQWTAMVMERRCGEESPFVIHVNLRPAAEPVRFGYFSGQADDGEIFAVEEDTQPAALAMEWVSSTQLTIRCPRCRAALKLSELLGPVRIRYEGGR